MMLKFGLAAAAAFALAIPHAVGAPAQQATGQVARDFKLTASDGRTVSLSQFRGRPVVLEWHNVDCPFVKKHYDSGNMQRTQAAATAAGAVWLTINSSAPGKQGHYTPAQARQFMASSGSRATHYLHDPRGVVGKGFDARTTPHMYVIDGEGRLVYQGGIDDKPTANQADIEGARNHVTAALAEVRAGRAVSMAETRPYGCSVKYPES